jgi:biotin carboxyl carrier protein
MSKEEEATKEFITFAIEDRTFQTHTTPKFANRRAYIPKDPLKVFCHIPGIIVKINVALGWEVKEGESLMVLEAMKMQNDILAHRSGRIRSVHVNVGDMATKGQVLLDFE